MPPRATTDANATATTQPEQRKQRAPLSKPPGMFNTDWKAKVQRREAVTTDRWNRANTKKARDRAALAAAVAEQADRAAEQAEASRAGMMNPPGGHDSYASWSQQSI